MEIFSSEKRNRICGWHKLVAISVPLAIESPDDNRFIGALPIIFIFCCLYRCCDEKKRKSLYTLEIPIEYLLIVLNLWSYVFSRQLTQTNGPNPPLRIVGDRSLQFATVSVWMDWLQQQHKWNSSSFFHWLHSKLVSVSFFMRGNIFLKQVLTDFECSSECSWFMWCHFSNACAK